MKFLSGGGIYSSCERIQPTFPKGGGREIQRFIDKKKIATVVETPSLDSSHFVILLGETRPRRPVARLLLLPPLLFLFLLLFSIPCSFHHFHRIFVNGGDASPTVRLQWNG